MNYKITICYTKKQRKHIHFWQAKLDGRELLIETGTVGKKSRTQKKTFANGDAGFDYYCKRVWERQREGFVKSGVIANPRAAPRQALALPELASASLEQAIEAVDQLRAYMDDVKNPDYCRLVLRKPTKTPRSTRVPPSYQAFVKQLGAFEIQSENGQSYYKMYLPTELATLSSDDVGNDSDPRRVRQLVRFQNAPYPDNVFVFDTSRKRANGESPVEIAYHDEEFSPGRAFTTFPSHIYELCREVAAKVK